MKQINFKSLDNLNGLDLTAIAYTVAFLVGVFCKVNLSFLFILTSALCVYVSFKKSKVALTLLNAVIFLYSVSNFWGVCVDTVLEWWEQITDKLWWLF